MSRITAHQDKPEEPHGIIRIPDPVVVRELASAMKLKPFAVIRDLMGFDFYVTSTQKSISPRHHGYAHSTAS
jgi:hypothetical protein